MMPNKLSECLELPRLDDDGRYVGGVCPALRCRYNLLVEITRHLDKETIRLVGAGQPSKGYAVSTIRKDDGGFETVGDDDLFVDAIVALADRLPSTCIWDYIMQPSLADGGAPEPSGMMDYSWRPHMTMPQVARIYGITREAVRLIEERAMRSVKVKVKAAADRDEYGTDRRKDRNFVSVGRLRNKYRGNSGQSPAS